VIDVLAEPPLAQYGSSIMDTLLMSLILGVVEHAAIVAGSFGLVWLLARGTPDEDQKTFIRGGGILLSIILIFLGWVSGAIHL
jgi:hypothetical protein